MPILTCWTALYSAQKYHDKVENLWKYDSVPGTMLFKKKKEKEKKKKQTSYDLYFNAISTIERIKTHERIDPFPICLLFWKVFFLFFFSFSVSAEPIHTFLLFVCLFVYFFGFVYFFFSVGTAVILINFNLGVAWANSKFYVTSDFDKNRLTDKLLNNFVFVFYFSFIRMCCCYHCQIICYTLLKEPSPSFQLFFQTFGDFAITRKVIFFS